MEDFGFSYSFIGAQLRRDPSGLRRDLLSLRAQHPTSDPRSLLAQWIRDRLPRSIQISGKKLKPLFQDLAPSLPDEALLKAFGFSGDRTLIQSPQGQELGENVLTLGDILAKTLNFEPEYLSTCLRRYWTCHPELTQATMVVQWLRLHLPRYISKIFIIDDDTVVLPFDLPEDCSTEDLLNRMNLTPQQIETLPV